MFERRKEAVRGTVWWAELPGAEGSGPGYRRPVLIVQNNDFTRSRIATVVVVMITSNLHLGEAPGNVQVRAKETGLSKESVINVSQIYTVDKTILSDYAGKVSEMTMHMVDRGLRLVLHLDN